MSQETRARFYRTCEMLRSTHCDRVIFDLTTGMQIIRYDLGDPANRDPDYGAITDDERLRRRGYDPMQRVALTECVVTPLECDSTLCTGPGHPRYEYGGYDC